MRRFYDFKIGTLVKIKDNIAPEMGSGKIGIIIKKIKPTFDQVYWGTFIVGHPQTSFYGDGLKILWEPNE